jgi:hypothetical protein
MMPPPIGLREFAPQPDTKISRLACKLIAMAAI